MLQPARSHAFSSVAGQGLIMCSRCDADPKNCLGAVRETVLRGRGHCAGTESGIDHSCCRASDVGGARQAGAVHPHSIHLHQQTTQRRQAAVGFDAFVLSELLGREVGLGKIIHGDDRATLKVNTGALITEVRRLTEKIGALLSSNSPPELILNRHCPECEFQNQCRQKAVEKDELSLLSGITETPEPSQQGDIHRHAAFLHFSIRR
jgi:hypothetical protein